MMQDATVPRQRVVGRGGNVPHILSQRTYSESGCKLKVYQYPHTNAGILLPFVHDRFRPKSFPFH